MKEIRRHLVTRDVAWLTGDRRRPGKSRFPGLATVLMVEDTVERAGTTNLPASGEEIAAQAVSARSSLQQL